MTHKLITIENVNIYGIAESAIASGFPMATDTSSFKEDVALLAYWIDKYEQKLVISDKKYSFLEFLSAHRDILIAGGATDSALDRFDRIVVKTAKRLSTLGGSKPASGHNCFAKGITVQFDLSMSQAMSQQMKRYHFIDIVSSTSTMHRITKMNIRKQCNSYVASPVISMLNHLVDFYNGFDSLDDEAVELMFADMFQLYGLELSSKKEVFYAIVYNIPSGLNLTARWTANYLQLITIYNQRKHHKLDEWREFCDWIESLPLFKDVFLNK